MFGSYKLQRLYKKNYKELLSYAFIKNCYISKPITAAYLFFQIDQIVNNTGFYSKKEHVDKILNIIKDDLTCEEFKIFNQAIQLMSNSLSYKFELRADWWLSDIPDSSEDPWINKLFFLYGDLIKFPNYLSDYQNSPVDVCNILEIMTYAKFFTSTVLPITKAYYNEIIKINFEL